MSAVPGQPAKAGGRGVSRCTYESLGPDEQATADGVAASGYGPPKGPEPGTWVRQVCIDVRGNVTGLVIWARRPAPPPNPAALAQEALGSAPLPLPGIGLNPSSRSGEVVNFTTWMWVTNDWKSVSATASLDQWPSP